MDDGTDQWTTALCLVFAASPLATVPAAPALAAAALAAAAAPTAEPSVGATAARGDNGPRHCR